MCIRDRYKSLFDPCMATWHVVHFWNFGSSILCLEDCSGTPSLRVPNPVAPLWHSKQSVNTTGRRSSFAFIEPCGLWQVSHPSTRTGACSYTNGPRLSMWHLRHGDSVLSACSIMRGFCPIFQVASNEPCGLWQSEHCMKPCLLYTSDAADDLTRVDLGGRRIIKK